LRWNIGPTAVLTGTVADTVTTPEGQLLDSLSSLTASSNGALTSSAALYANGTSSMLASFNAQGYGSLSYNQNIARYQTANLTYAQDFGRDHAMLSVYYNKQTILDAFFIGQPENTSYGANANLTHDLTRLLSATVGGGYTRYQELGGHADVVNVNAGVNYTLSPDTSVYLRGDYLNRTSSQSLQTLSPFTGSLDDIRISLGLSHRL
jgi:predicted porin